MHSENSYQKNLIDTQIMKYTIITKKSNRGWYFMFSYHFFFFKKIYFFAFAIVETAVLPLQKELHMRFII